MAKIHRFIGDFDLSKKEFEITGEIAKQMALVLKLKIDEKIELCDRKHASAIAFIRKIDKKSVLVKIEEFLEKKEMKNKVNLFCAVLKKENFELVVQKTTECGISRIIPIITSHTVKTGLNIERLKKIAHEASEQSGRTDVPEILEPINFTKALKNTQGESFFFDSSGDYSFITRTYSPAGELLCSARQPAQCVLKKQSPDSFNLFIGPEGGWTKEEIELAKKNNFKIASLGPLTLRGETATIIASYLVVNL